MMIQEAIALLKGPPLPDCDIQTAQAIRVLLSAYEELYKSFETVAPKMLDEMQNAADWEAVAIKQLSMLRRRKEPGMDAVIEDFIQKLDARNQQQTNKSHEQQNTDGPQG